MALRSLERECIFPQELLDEIVADVAEMKTLQACAVVAHRLQHSSQKRIWNHLTVTPTFADDWLDEPNICADALISLLTESPRLGQHVRSLKLFANGGTWLDDASLAGAISTLSRLTTVAIEANGEPTLNWNGESFPDVLLAAVSTAIRLPTLTSLKFNNVNIPSTADLAALIGGCSSLGSLSFINSGVRLLDLDHAKSAGIIPPEDMLHLSSLTLLPFLPPIIHCLNRNIAPSHLRHLHLALQDPFSESDFQYRILDHAHNLEHLRLRLDTDDSHGDTLELGGLSRLRTLELDFGFYIGWDSDEYDPVGWAGAVISQLTSAVRRVILNIELSDDDLEDSALGQLHALGPVLKTHLKANETRGRTQDAEFIVKVQSTADDSDIDFSRMGEEIREEILRQLQEFGVAVQSICLAEDVLPLVSDPSPIVYKAALFALAQFSSHSSGALAVCEAHALHIVPAFLRSPESKARTHAARMLGNIAAHDETVARIVALNPFLSIQLVTMLSDSDAAVRRAALDALLNSVTDNSQVADMIEAGVIAPLFHLLFSGDSAVLGLACRMLGVLSVGHRIYRTSFPEFELAAERLVGHLIYADQYLPSVLFALAKLSLRGEVATKLLHERIAEEMLALSSVGYPEQRWVVEILSNISQYAVAGATSACW
ncbi:hypothetical protein MKEN_00990700 [Mycena kentingensis (nom. inval.)]|nr:hypothetical protein MKEN_00990700 [Mycena kentingensis (nom. inval.)]